MAWLWCAIANSSPRFTLLHVRLTEFAESFSQARGASAKEHPVFFGEKQMEGLAFAAIGAAGGAALFVSCGGAGLAFAGTAYPILLGGFVLTGAAAGLAVYGAKKTVLG
jgi:hypothetical protein